jgi:hypothetical protein
MKAMLVGFAAFPLACSIGSAGLTLSVGSDPLIADGTSARAITVCNSSDEPAASVTATLRASSGSWARATGSDKQQIEVQLTSGAKCADEVWLPPTQPGPTRFEVQVGDTVQIREDATLIAATVDQIAVQASPPTLSTSGSSSIAISVGFTTASGGEPSDGTVVNLRLLDSDPLGAAALDDGPIVVGKKETLTLIAAEGTSSVRLQATLKDSTPVIQDCRVLSPLGAKPTLKCD